MNQTKTEAKQVINKAVVEAWRTWILSARDMQEILISIAGDIAVSENISNATDSEKRPDFISMANSLANMLLEAASKGYVSSNDLDYANDCLDKVIPYLKLRSRLK